MSQQSSLTQSAHSVRQVLTAYRRVFQTGLSTYTAILRLYKKECLQLLLLCSYDKDLLPEILIKAQVLKLHVEELPVVSVWGEQKTNKRGKGISLVATGRKASGI